MVYLLTFLELTLSLPYCLLSFQSEYDMIHQLNYKSSEHILTWKAKDVDMCQIDNICNLALEYTEVCWNRLVICSAYGDFSYRFRE